MALVTSPPKSTWPGVSMRLTGSRPRDVWTIEADAALIVMPRADSCSSKSSTLDCQRVLGHHARPAIRLSESVVFPWSMWAAIARLRIRSLSCITSVALLMLSSLRPI